MTNRTSGGAARVMGADTAAGFGANWTAVNVTADASSGWNSATIRLRVLQIPDIIDMDTKFGTVTSNSTSWTLTWPTNLGNGDLVLAFVATDGDTSTTTWPANWVDREVSSGGAVTGHIAKFLSDGTQTGTFTLTVSATEQGAWRIFRITGWEGTLGDPFSGTTGGAIQAGNLSNVSANPDPPSLDPVTWDVEDTLWFAACMVDTSRTISVFPLADRQTEDNSGGAGGATLGLCSTNSAVASLDPGTFTISASDDWEVYTVAVRPAAAGAPATSLIYSPRPMIRNI
jgi:hypothetical protein